jgi:hypothetical protein
VRAPGADSRSVELLDATPNSARRGAAKHRTASACVASPWSRRIGRCASPTPTRPIRGRLDTTREQTEVDHARLIAELVERFPDGWALSTSAEALPDVLALCPRGVRVCAWVKAARVVPSYRPAKAWEPVIVAGGRPLRVADRGRRRVRDALIARGRFRAFPGALVGMKPPAFSEWIFRLLGAQTGDKLVDLFPGSGAVTRAWERYVGAELSRGAN